jgi:hypothetical protein
MMTLQQSWMLLDYLNDKANRISEDIWSTNDINSAILHQTECLRNFFLELNDTQKQSIQYWIIRDDEFLDYVECLLGEEFTKNLL